MAELPQGLLTQHALMVAWGEFADWGEAGVAHPFFTPMIALRVLAWRLDLPTDDEDLALLSGINPERVVAIAWIIAAALAAIAGTLYGLDKTYKPFIFLQILLPIFAATILGGIGQPVGAVLGGFIVASSEVTVTYAFRKFLAYLGPQDWAPEGLVQLLSTEYKFAVSFIILVAVLLIRPTGIIRGKVI
ncbi:MAG: hypothetical protein P8X52_09305 [Limibacillus sp.]